MSGLISEPEFKKGSAIIFEYKKSNNGRKYTCRIKNIQTIDNETWVVDELHGTCFSSSFKPTDVIVWETYRAR